MEGQTMRNRDRKPELQVMICTYGRDGLRRIASSQHPEVEGIEYLVSVQHDPDDDIYPIPKELDRVDFRLFPTPTRGLSVNRNMALSLASAPILLISDDDVEYTKNGLRSVIDAFHEHRAAARFPYKCLAPFTPRRTPAVTMEILH